MPNDISIVDKLELKTFEEDDSSELPPSDIIAYNELRSCADLFRMYNQGILDIQPKFQREIVWKDPAQTRFIDSLIKQLPIPSMCFSLDYKTQKWQVIDGLQRMWTIIRFLSGTDWVLSSLEDIDPVISGKQVREIKDFNSSLHRYYTRVENLTLPITVLRCDYSKKSHNNYLFTIFHRLNAGGERLNNQEIRNCIYSGTFNDLLKKLNANPNWMKINKMKRTGGYRFLKEELILRFFSFNDRYSAYDGKLASFLNSYMNDFRNPGNAFLLEKEDLFNRTVSVISNSVFNNALPRKMSIAIFEALMVGISKNIDFLETLPPPSVNNFYMNLQNNEEFSEEKLKEGLASKSGVMTRMSIAERIFSGH